MSGPGIAEKIAAFPRWHYEFDLDGHKTPIFDAAHAVRHRERRGYFFETLVDLCGGNLAGKRILDLGCNAGFWALAAIEAGCDRVVGIDGRAMHIEQANFVFEVKGVAPDRYDFRLGNVFEVVDSALGAFDIVLCLGLLYHVSKPMELFERIAAVNRDLLVVDTVISLREDSSIDIHHEALDEPRHALDYELVMVPSRSAVREMVRQFGYDSRVLAPRFSDYTGSRDYRAGGRRAFLCSKETPLEGIERARVEETPDPAARPPHP